MMIDGDYDYHGDDLNHDVSGCGKYDDLAIMHHHQNIKKRGSREQVCG